jgi:hypothetical protein
VRCTPGAGFTRADLHRPGPHVGATNYKGKISSQLGPRDRTYGLPYLAHQMSEEISSWVAESTHLILVKDGFGVDLGTLDRCADERRKDARI